MSFEGEIGEIDLIQRLVELGRERFTGAIRFEQDGIIKIVYFKGGDVLSASTNDRIDAVDEILLRAGKVDKEHVKQALSRRKENESLGDALLNLGFITRKELTWGRRIQVIGILRSVKTWDHGQYAIVADYLPKREEGTLFPLQQTLIEMYVTDQDRSPYERALEGGSAVLEKTAEFELAFARLGLNEDASEIATKIDGKRTVAEIAAVTGKDIFNTYKLLEALRALGLLRKLESESKAEVKDELAFSSLGVADAADAWSSGKMPAFQLEPEPPVQPAMESAPPPPPMLPDVQWGFDEAQIETANQAAESRPLPPPPVPIPRSVTHSQTQSRRTPPKFARPEAKKRGAPVFLMIVLLIIGAASFAAWWYWKQLNAEPVPIEVVRPMKPPVNVTPIPPPAPVPGPAPVPAPAPQPVLAQPAPAPTPTPSVVAGAPAGTRAGGAPATTLATQAANKFTLQVELVCQDASLRKATAMGGDKVWSSPITYRGQQCYRVFWGRYPTRAAAEAAVGEIPAGLRGSKPVAVTIPTP
jgi:septal ring-binding cell division protein DamX